MSPSWYLLKNNYSFREDSKEDARGELSLWQISMLTLQSMLLCQKNFSLEFSEAFRKQLFSGMQISRYFYFLDRVKIQGHVLLRKAIRTCMVKKDHLK